MSPKLILEVHFSDTHLSAQDGRYRIDHALPRVQKNILGSFGIDEEWVRKDAIKVADALAVNTEKRK